MVELALGTVQFGLAYGVAGADRPLLPEISREILVEARKAGIRRLDTAPAYGDIEQRLNELIADLDFEIVSKISRVSKYTDVKEAMERSLERLGSGLKGMLFHDPDILSSEPECAIWASARQFCADNSLELGVSYYNSAEVALDNRRLTGFSMAQVPGNALDQRMCSHAASLKNVEITMRSAFLQGLLVIEQEQAARRVPRARTALENWHRWCTRMKLSPVAAALAVAKSIPANFILIGVDNLSQLRETIAIWNDVEPIEATELACDDADVIDPRRWPRHG